MLLTALTDEEFLRHAQAQHEPLGASLIEIELLRRFSSLLDRAEVGDNLTDVCHDHGLDASRADLAARLEQPGEQPGEWADKKVHVLTDLLDELEIQDHATLRRVDAVFNVAVEHDLDTPEALKTQLERLRRFDAVLADLTAPIQTLTDLAATA